MHLSSPSTITIMRSLSKSASSMLCVVMMMAFSFFIYWMSFHTFLRDFGSMPVVGSSKKMMEGSPMLDRARESRRFIPPLKVPVTALANFESSTSRSFAFISFGIACLLNPLIRAKSSMCSAAVRSSHSISNYGQNAIFLRISSMSSIRSKSFIITCPLSYER